jgi:hypothetical protein
LGVSDTSHEGGVEGVGGLDEKGLFSVFSLSMFFYIFLYIFPQHSSTNVYQCHARYVNIDIHNFKILLWGVAKFGHLPSKIKGAILQ